MNDVVESNEAPKKPKSAIKKIIGRSTAAIGGLVLLGGCYLTTPKFQRGAVYRPETTLTGDPLPPLQDPHEYGLKDVTAETLSTKDSDDFKVWHSEPLVRGQKTLLLFSGNGGHLGHAPLEGRGGEILGDAEDQHAYLDMIREAQAKGWQVIATQPVGFADGDAVHPTQDNMFKGAEKVIDWATEQGLKPNDLEIVGMSMGTTLAAHAANYLSQQTVFTRDDNQNISLTMVNGVNRIDEEVGKTPVIGGFLEAVWHEDMNTGEELEAMGNGPHADRIKARFLRGQEDPVTPDTQTIKHQEAASPLELETSTVPGRHYPEPSLIFDFIEETGQNKSPNR